MIRVAAFSSDGRVELGGRELLARPPQAGESRWIDLEGDSGELEGVLRGFGYHPLSIEDAFTFQHQPKVEEFEDYLFVIVRGIDFNRQSGGLETLKLAAFLSADRLVTFHRASMRSAEAVRKRLSEGGRGPSGGMAALLHALCDEIVDHYFPILDGIGAEIERLEEEIFEEPDEEHLERTLELRRQLSTLRRVMLPHRQVFNHLASLKSPLIDEHVALHFRDIYDNVFRLADAIDQQRDQLNSARDTYLSVISQRTNDVMKILTLFSAFFLPLTFLAGIYGMNFEFMPELDSRYGYFALLGVMAVTAVGMFAWFRHKGWL